MRDGGVKSAEILPSSKSKDAMGALDDTGVVRGEDKGHAEFTIELFHQVQQRFGGARIEVGGGLIGEHKRGMRGQGAGDGHALLLAAGEFRRHAVHAIAESDTAQQLFGARESFGPRNSLQQHDEFDVLRAVRTGIRLYA